MSQRRHVVITGTGRCGTTFLVELLTHLGLDTGFSVDTIKYGKYQKARAGLEHDIREDGCPFVVKSPVFCDRAKEILSRDDISVEHILVPMRDLNAAAESRRYVVEIYEQSMSLVRRLKYVFQPGVSGGLTGTNSTRPGKQEDVLLRRMYKLVLAASNSFVPMTFMRYPRIVKDCSYLYAKLAPVLKGVDYETFSTVFEKVAQPDIVHSFNDNDR